jgi:hypothetical protein
MSFPQGIDFRNTTGFVTDPTNCDPEIGTTANYPRTTAQGNSVGWEDAIGANTRNRSTGVDARLAGLAFATNSGGNKRYRIDLPNGTYNLSLAFGDATTSGARISCQIFDGATLLASFSDVSSGAGQWVDATGTVRTSSADWVSNNQSISITITSGILRVKIGTGTLSGNTTMSHIFVDHAAILDSDTVINTTTPSSTESTDFIDSETPTIITIAFEDPVTTDADTANNVTTPSAVLAQGYADNNTISSITTPSSSEIYSRVDSATVNGTTVVTSDDRGPFADFDTIISTTTPAVTVELTTNVTIEISNDAIVGDPIIATIVIDVPNQSVSDPGSGASGTGTTVGGDTETSPTVPGGYWGSTDDDDGIIP